MRAFRNEESSTGSAKTFRKERISTSVTKDRWLSTFYGVARDRSLDAQYFL